MDSRKLKKSIFRANFYESRRLRHDGFIDYMVRDTNSRKIYTKPFSIARKLFSFMGILFMFGFSALMETQIHHPDPDAPFDTWGINFYPLWLFFLCWFLWFLVCRKNLRRKYDAKIPYTSILNSNLYLIWLVFVLNLFFITFIGKYLTILGLLLFYVLTGIILFMIIQSRMKSLKTRLYGVQDPSATAKQQKFIEVITGLANKAIAQKYCITRNKESSLAHLCDYSIEYAVKEERKDIFLDLTSQLPAIAIVETLIGYLQDEPTPQ